MKYLEVIEKEKGVKEVWLNRPELHNAFNAELIEEMISVFEGFKNERLIILSGRGQSFCAGADLNWMKAMKNYTKEENFRDSKRLARMFAAINDCDVPVIGRINGHALGGGVGLVSVCDLIVFRKWANQMLAPGCFQVRGLTQKKISAWDLCMRSARPMNLISRLKNIRKNSSLPVLKLRKKQKDSFEG